MDFPGRCTHVTNCIICLLTAMVSPPMAMAVIHAVVFCHDIAMARRMVYGTLAEMGKRSCPAFIAENPNNVAFPGNDSVSASVRM